MLRGSAAGGLGQGIFFHWVALHIEELTVVVKLVLLGPHPAFAVFAFGKRELTEILLRPGQAGPGRNFFRPVGRRGALPWPIRRRWAANR